MASIDASGVLTLADLAKRQDPNGAAATVVELLSEHNPIIDHASAIEGNLPTGHRFTLRDSLPTVGLRTFNAGVAASKSTTRQVDEACSHIEAYSDIDEALCELNGDTKKTRWSEDQAFIEAMNQQAVDLLFYGQPSDDAKEFLGFANRYSSTSVTAYGENTFIADTPSGSDCTSIFGITWHPNATFLITPRGSVAGLQVNDKGKQRVTDASGNPYWAYETQFIWKLGLGVRDWRQNCRIQFDLSALSAFGTTTAQDVLDKLIEGFSHIQNKALGKFCWYCSREMYTYLWQAATRLTANSTLSLRDDIEDGRAPMRLLGKPVYELDGLLVTESAIS
jgi:hypothetical protein